MQVTNEDIVDRLDRIVAILQLANRDQIEATRASIRSDKVNAAILDNAKGWTGSAKLVEAVKTKTKQSYPTINRRINDLLAVGVLEKQGGGRTTEYRSAGLI
jgi:Fic family protein